MGRKVIDSTKQIRNLKKNKNLLLSIVFVSIFIVLSILIGMLLLDIEFTTVTLVSILLLILLLIELLLIKPKIMYIGIQYRYLLLISKSKEPYKVDEIFNTKWITKIVNSGYKYSYKGDYVDVLYRLSKPLERNVFTNNSLLEIITIIKDNAIDFYDDILNDLYKNIWQLEQAKNKVSKQVIIQFKLYDDINDHITDDLNRIISYREGKNHLVTINCGYFKKNQLFYYLHSDHYAPTLYYKHGVDLIQNLVK